VRTPSPAEKEFLLPSVRELPEYGRLTGRGGTANIENVLKFKPDLIIDIGSVGGTYVSLANNVQERPRSPTCCWTARSRRRRKSIACLATCWG
jgi:iron complex transport system substrate-binding protein